MVFGTADSMPSATHPLGMANVGNWITLGKWNGANAASATP